MVHYKPVKIIIHTSGHAEVILDVVVRHYGLPYVIVYNRSSVFNSKIWLSLCYFMKIKKRLSMTFNPQIDGQVER